jgi:GntR family transcriptional regulator
VIDRDRPVPLYYQLELQLRERVESGLWRAGDRLPTESELAAQFGVSRITVRQALERLEDDGLISRQRGRGTFVHSGVSPVPKIERDPDRLHAFEQDILRQGLEPEARVLALEEVPTPAHVAELLRIPTGEVALRLRRLGTADRQPLWLESRYFPIEIGRAIRDRDLTSPVISRIIEQVCGRRIASSRLRIEARAATANQAQQLKIASGAPVLLNEFVYYDDRDLPVQALQAFFRADRYAFTFHVKPKAEGPSAEAWIAGLATAGRAR